MCVGKVGPIVGPERTNGDGMARTLHKLTSKEVDGLGLGRHSDGGGLYLDNDPGRSRWVYIWTRKGKRREMGLGSAGPGGLTLAKARKRAAEAREIVADGGDPIIARNAQRCTTLIPTFGVAVDEFLLAKSAEWRNDKHREQWKMTLNEYAAPLKNLRVDEVDTEAIVGVLRIVWTTKPETASRLRGRIERVLDAAKAKGQRHGENPARWRGHLDNLLPRRQKLSRGHHAAMPYGEVPAFINQLHSHDGVAARALEFLILTAARTGEVLGATWAEVDLDRAIWTVPAKRMKAAREHRVPLCARAIEILALLAPLTKDDPSQPIFPGQKGRGLSSMALLMQLRRMKAEVTAHGFRSSFRDWAGEASTFPREVAEAALAHRVGDAVELAYRRGDALQKRRKLMDAWAGFCMSTKTTGGVVQLARISTGLK